MAYFSNSDEGYLYEEQYCVHCRHYGDEDNGCPIWGAHLHGNYVARTPGNNVLREVLDMLIPREKDGSNGICRFFAPNPASARIECYRGIGHAPDQSAYVQPWPMPEKK